MTCIEKGIEHELVPVAVGSAEHGALRPRMRTWMELCSDYVFRDVVRAIPRRRGG